LSPDYEPEFESYKSLLLDMGQERGLDALLRLIVRRLAERPHLALARIWLRAPGDVCAACSLQVECPDRAECLHLVASAGTPQTAGDDYGGLGGRFRRFPIGIRKIGRIAASGEGLMAAVEGESPWLVDSDWAEREGILGFAGQPLIHGERNLGVLAVFLRIPPRQEGLQWLRMIADHAAGAITNARAFEEIGRLKHQLELERDYLREEVREARAFGQILGESPALRSMLEQIELVAPTEANVLVLGESGTGKELVACEIHKRSARHDRALVKVNCATVPRELFESEFFGHAKGSFTGAVKDRVGRFATADGGTLFLDEVGEIPLELQSKLLRVLQEGEFERVGEDKTRKVDVRVVAATNRDLRAEVEAGRFREDLYYRLAVFPVEVVPLRDRLEDIPILAEHFLELAARRLKTRPPRITQGDVLRLQQYDWPGNVREFQNVIERAVIVSQGGKLRLDLPGGLRRPPPASHGGQRQAVLTDDQLRQLERDNVVAALEQAQWQISGEGGAAALLGIKPSTLTSRMKKMGIERP